MLGVGRGGPWVDLEVFGTGLERFERGFGESLDLLCAALSRDAVVGYVAGSTERAVVELKRSMPGWLRPSLAGYVPVERAE
jgi:hypothetical protein